MLLSIHKSIQLYDQWSRRYGMIFFPKDMSRVNNGMAPKSFSLVVAHSYNQLSFLDHSHNLTVSTIHIHDIWFLLMNIQKSTKYKHLFKKKHLSSPNKQQIQASQFYHCFYRTHNINFESPSIQSMNLLLSVSLFYFTHVNFLKYVFFI